ncbi:MAG: hypothetical protein KIT24_03460 [Phycisphaeraceae bacterium]|nr:hypothetical protein [Phycisphaeraceae bacterium]
MNIREISPENMYKTLPLMLIALLMGMVMFAVVGLFVSGAITSTPVQPPSTPTPATPPPSPAFSADTERLLLMLAGALMLSAMAGYAVLGAVGARKAAAQWAARTNDGDGRTSLAQLFVQFTFLRAAIAEGAGMFACVGLLLTGNLLFLSAVGVAALLLATLLPVRRRFDQLVERVSQAPVFPITRT